MRQTTGRILRKPSALVLALATLCIATIANAERGAGSLLVSGAAHTPTHWNIPLGSATRAEIRGVANSEVGNPPPATIAVFVKSSTNGNVQLTATRTNGRNYTFTYTPPTPGPGTPTCGTTTVAYARVDLDTNNDLVDDNMQNGTGMATSGFRMVDAAGSPVDCPTAVEPSPWGLVKSMYR